MTLNNDVAIAATELHFQYNHVPLAGKHHKSFSLLSWLHDIGGPDFSKLGPTMNFFAPILGLLLAAAVAIAIFFAIVHIVQMSWASRDINRYGVARNKVGLAIQSAVVAVLFIPALLLVYPILQHFAH